MVSTQRRTKRDNLYAAFRLRWLCLLGPFFYNVVSVSQPQPQPQPCLALPCFVLWVVSPFVSFCLVFVIVVSCPVLCLVYKGGNVDETFSIGHVIEICKAPPPMNFSASMKVRQDKAAGQPPQDKAEQDKTATRQDKTTTRQDKTRQQQGRSLTRINFAWWLVACSDRPCDVSYPIPLSSRIVLCQPHKGHHKAL
jgi:hypothetical protein